MTPIGAPVATIAASARTLGANLRFELHIFFLQEWLKLEYVTNTGSDNLSISFIEMMNDSGYLLNYWQRKKISWHWHT